jgi:hypothetical protein
LLLSLSSKDTFTMTHSIKHFFAKNGQTELLTVWFEATLARGQNNNCGPIVVVLSCFFLANRSF